MASEETTRRPVVARKPNPGNFIGIGNLPKQVRRKSVKKGFHFTLMVVGESGLGKSTLLNSLFLTDVYVDGEYKEPCSIFDKTMCINESTIHLKENNVNLNLTVIDTPGFGDHIDNTDSWNAIIENIEDKFAAYLNAESRVYRTPDIPDNRVHCCLYFIAPTGHTLKQLDIEFMKRLHNKINIVPLIAKADTLTAEECASFKTQILKEIEENNINIYKFPPLKHITTQKDTEFIDRIPFAVVGSNAVLEMGGKKIRGRKYPWGIVDVENLEHCDFLALRNLLVRSHMQDLIDVTNEQHYEMYRSDKLAMATTGGRGEAAVVVTRNVNPLEQIEKEREERERKLKTMEVEMEQVFNVKVQEKKKKLLDAEQEFSGKYDVTMEALRRSREEVEERRRRFEEERNQLCQHTDFQAVMMDDFNKKEKKKHKNKTVKE